MALRDMIALHLRANQPVAGGRLHPVQPRRRPARHPDGQRLQGHPRDAQEVAPRRRSELRLHLRERFSLSPFRIRMGRGRRPQPMSARLPGRGRRGQTKAKAAWPSPARRGQGGGSHEGLRRQDCGGHRRRLGNGPRAGAPAGGRGLQRRHVRCLRPGHGRDAAAVRRRHRRRARASPRTSPTSPMKRRSCASATRSPRPRYRQDPPAVQQRRHRRRRQHDHQQPRRMGDGPSTSAGAASTSARAPSCRCCMKADEGHIVNTSSVNGFWASVGPRIPHTAYCAAKFAVKGFTEALITDLRLNAPHIKCSVVMPGPHRHLDRRQLAQDPERRRCDAHEPRRRSRRRAHAWRRGRDVSQMSERDIQEMVAERARQFRDEAPTTRRGRGDDHPRRGQGRSLAHSGRRRRPSARRARAPGPGTRLRDGILRAVRRRGVGGGRALTASVCESAIVASGEARPIARSALAVPCKPRNNAWQVARRRPAGGDAR